MARRKKKTAERLPSPTLSLTQETVDELCRIVGRGNFRYVAAQKLGIPRGTFSSWIQRGKRELREFAAGTREDVSLQANLVRELDAAEARCHDQLLMDVVTSDSLQAKQWFLERRYNKLYSKNPNARVDDETGEEMKVDALDLLAEKLRTLMGDE